MTESKKQNKQNDKITQEINEKQKPEKLVYSLITDIRNNLLQLQKMISSKQLRQVLKITKSVRKYKNVIRSHHLHIIWMVFFPQQNINFQSFPDFKKDYNENLDITKAQLSKLKKIEQIEIYLQTLLLIYFTKYGYINQAEQLNKSLLLKIQNLNSFYANALCSISYFYVYRINERNNNVKCLRPLFMNAYKKAMQRKDQLSQATLLNLILRNFLQSSEYEAAKNFIQFNDFPQNRSNNQFCKFLYYTGFLKLIYMDYQQSFSRLTQAIHKMPDNTAFGFKIKCLKASIVAELLLGQIPNRQIFTQKKILSSLSAYYGLIQRVLKGNMQLFKDFVSQNRQTFLRDKLYYVIIRLSHIVIKIGLRKINMSYSAIRINQVAAKLAVQERDVQFIVAKAIRDGVLDATIINQEQILIMNQKKDIYSTIEPQNAFARRIEYCLNLYHSAQKALTFPKKQFEQQSKQSLSDGDLDQFDILLDLDEL